MNLYTRNYIRQKYNPLVVKDKNSDAIAYVIDDPRVSGRVVVMAFTGKSDKPAMHYQFKTLADAEKSIARVFKSRQTYMAFRKEQRDKRAALDRGVNVGDIFYTSWGYDQTNLDFYQAVKLVGKYTVILRKVALESVEDQGDRGNAVAIKDEFVSDKEYRVQMRGGGGKLDGHYLNKWDGKPKYWSSYA